MSASNREHLLDINNLEMKAETDKAIKVWAQIPGEWIWLPKSQIEFERTGVGGRLADITIPEWLAIEKGLV